MFLPNSEFAIIEIVKLSDYCLNEFHPVGKHKAIVFKTALGLDNRHSDYLKDIVLQGIKTNEAIELPEDAYGKRFVVDMEISNFARAATIRTSWIIRINEDFPRLISCYVK